MDKCRKLDYIYCCFQTGELKQIRSLASNITTRGATLFDLLRREVNLRVS